MGIRKPLHFVGSSRKDLRDLPEDIRREFGYALLAAQEGEKSDAAFPLAGFGSAQVLEVVASQDGSTFRAVYTVKFPRAVYVLHVFQKKSKSGIATPKLEMDLIRSRLKIAEEDYQRVYGRPRGKERSNE